MKKQVKEPKHCDDYIRDKSQPKALRAFLLFKRIPAAWQYGKWLEKGWPEPKLFAKHHGRKVRVVMASRFGDVGITRDLGAERGYTKRVFIEELTGFVSKQSEL